MAKLPSMDDWERMAGEYRTLDMYPGGHLLERLRPHLPPDVLSSVGLRRRGEGEWVRVAGLVARPLQHPLSEAYFITLEDEHGMIPLIIWPGVYERFKRELREPLLMVRGTVSRREGTLNVVVQEVVLPGSMGLEGYPEERFRAALRLPRPVFR